MKWEHPKPVAEAIGLGCFIVLHTHLVAPRCANDTKMMERKVEFAQKCSYKIKIVDKIAKSQHNIEDNKQ